MHVMPIISSLRRHRTAAVLVILEIAVTCAIVCNAIFLVHERLARMDQPSGIVEDELVDVHLTGIGKKADAYALTDQDLVALRGIPGVRSAVVLNMVPFGGSSWNTSISTIPDDPAAPINAAMYMGSPGIVDTLGVKLVAGRDYTSDEWSRFEDIQDNKAKMPSVVISKGVADKLFPGGSAIGKPLYVWGKQPQTVVGVYDQLARPNVFEGAFDLGTEYSMILPIRVPYTIGGHYMLRVDPAQQGAVLALVEDALNRVDRGRIFLDKVTFAEIRQKHFNKDRAMAWLLVGVSLALLVITALGVVGLASFWVQQRTRQIGIRRALGATKGDILRYFQTENFILATCGIVLGMALAYAINLWLMDKYEVPRLPATFLPIGAAVLWALGQLAVLGPALRASAIAPAIATRSV